MAGGLRPRLPEALKPDQVRGSGTPVKEDPLGAALRSVLFGPGCRLLMANLTDDIRADIKALELIGVLHQEDGAYYATRVARFSSFLLPSSPALSYEQGKAIQPGQTPAS